MENTTTNRLELLQNVLIASLKDAINVRHPENQITGETDKDVFSRLTDLYDEKKEIEFGTETGKAYKYMPKQYKEMVLRLVAPYAYFNYRQEPSDQGYAVTALLYLDCRDKEQSPVAIGESFVSFESVPENIPEAERRSFAKATAKGLAESKAMQKFGIGSWYSYRFEPEENPDVAESKIQEKQDRLNSDPIGAAIAQPEKTPENAAADNDGEKPFQQTIKEIIEETMQEEMQAYENPLMDDDLSSIPDIPGIIPESDAAKETEETETTVSEQAQEKSPAASAGPAVKAKKPRAAKKAKAQVNEAAEETVKDTVAETAMAAEENSNAESDASEKVSVTATSTMSIEEARSTLADIGKAKAMGLTLGETADRFPGNILWMYQNPQTSEVNRKAMAVIVMQSSELQEMFKSRNITL